VLNPALLLCCVTVGAGGWSVPHRKSSQGRLHRGPQEEAATPAGKCVGGHPALRCSSTDVECFSDYYFTVKYVVANACCQRTSQVSLSWCGALSPWSFVRSSWHTVPPVFARALQGPIAAASLVPGTRAPGTTQAVSPPPSRGRQLLHSCMAGSRRPTHSSSLHAGRQQPATRSP
jgi:hypothetical protein